jgi:hypothetical protein
MDEAMTVDRLRKWAGAAAILAAIFVLISSAGAAPAGGRTYLGWARVVPRNLVMTEKAAVTDALRRVVADEVQRIIRPDVFAARLGAIARQILARPERFIVSHQIVGRGRGGGGYQVLVKARANARAVKKALGRLGLLVSARDVPPVLILCTQRTGQEPWQYWWGQRAASRRVYVSQRVLETEMRRLKATVRPADKLAVPTSLRRLLLTDYQVRRMGRLAKSEVVILGRVTIKKAAGAGAARSLTIQLKAVQVKTGADLGVRTFVGPLPAGGSVRNGLARAAAVVLPRLVQDILARLSQKSGPTLKVKVILTNITDADDMYRFETISRSLAMVRKITQEGVGSGRAVFTLVIQGDLKDLQTQLLAQDYRTFLISIKKTADQELTVTIVPKI